MGRRYLSKYFGRREIEEVFPPTHLNRSDARRRAFLTSRATRTTAEIDGMELVVVEGKRVTPNEVSDNRVLLAPLATGEGAPASA